LKKSKYDRILSLYSTLTAGDVVYKPQAAVEFGVNERTIQRDIDDIRAFFANNTLGIVQGQKVIYDRPRGGYRIEDAAHTIFTNSEILAVCKILLESRSLVKSEMMPIIDKLLQRCIPEKNKKKVINLIRNEQFHYIEPQHGVRFVNSLWDLGTAIQEQRIIEVEYARLKGQATVRRRLKPVGIMVSEFYFYLTAFIDDIDKQEHFENPNDLFPTIYRIDRIRELSVLDERFSIPYADRFDEGEFRKRVQFMYGGKLQKIRFIYKGMSLESVLDRLPTATVIGENEVETELGPTVEYTIEAEVFGKGIEMWLRSQGDNVQYDIINKNNILGGI